MGQIKSSIIIRILIGIANNATNIADGTYLEFIEVENTKRSK